MVANVLVEGTSVLVRVYVRHDDDQFAVAVVEVVVVVVDVVVVRTGKATLYSPTVDISAANHSSPSSELSSVKSKLS